MPDAHFAAGPAREVGLFDVARGLPQRVEGQYLRHWGIAPALWKLHFRERVNLGASLIVAKSLGTGGGNQSADTGAVIAAADLFEELEKGHFKDSIGKRRRVDGDVSKLKFATFRKLQRRLIGDFRFRCGAIPDAQETRANIGHMGSWACAQHWNGIFFAIFARRNTQVPCM